MIFKQCVAFFLQSKVEQTPSSIQNCHEVNLPVLSKSLTIESQLRRALEEYLRIQRLVSPFFSMLCSLSHYEQHGSHDGFCVFNLCGGGGAVSC